MNNNKKRLFPLALLGAAVILPFVIDNPYYQHLFVMMYVNAILGMGFALIYSAGLITLGASAFWGVGAYTSALLVTKGDLSFWAALPLSTLVVGVFSLCVGYIIVRYAGVGFVVFTLLICFVIERMFGYVKIFGGWGGIIGIPPPDSIPVPFLGSIDFSSKLSSYFLGLFFLLVTIVSFWAFQCSYIGRAWKSIKLDHRLAETSGVYVFGYRLTAFVIASAFTGLAGSFYAHYSMTINPATFDLLKSIHIQIYAILGGLEYYIFGPIAGSVIFTLLPELLQINPDLEPYITGATLIFIVIFLPGGLIGLLKRLSKTGTSLLNAYQRRIQ